jgi:hypothetical protein
MTIWIGTIVERISGNRRISMYGIAIAVNAPAHRGMQPLEFFAGFLSQRKHG